MSHHDPFDMEPLEDLFVIAVSAVIITLTLWWSGIL